MLFADHRSAGLHLSSGCARTNVYIYHLTGSSSRSSTCSMRPRGTERDRAVSDTGGPPGAATPRINSQTFPLILS